MARVRTRLLALCLGSLLALPLLAQHVPPARLPSTPPPHPTSAEQKRGAPAPPTHDPQPELPPLAAFAHVHSGHDAWLAARSRKQPAPAPGPRPAGAGRYVAAVLVCADCDLDVPAMLGLARADVLLLSVPGPFLSAETTAAIERQVLAERLSLVLVLTHARCTTLEPPAPAPKDPIAARVRFARAEAERRRLPLGRCVGAMQRELLLAASDTLAVRAAEDKLRVVPGEIDDRSGAITWLQKPIDELPMPPVK